MNLIIQSNMVMMKIEIKSYRVGTADVMMDDFDRYINSNDNIVIIMNIIKVRGNVLFIVVNEVIVNKLTTG